MNIELSTFNVESRISGTLLAHRISVSTDLKTFDVGHIDMDFTMELTGKQRRFLRGLVNTEKAVAFIGTAGVTDNIVEEVKLALFKHELIKIKVSGQDDRSKKKEFSAELAERCEAHEVQILGNTIVLYKQNPEVKGIRLPKNRA